MNLTSLYTERSGRESAFSGQLSPQKWGTPPQWTVGWPKAQGYSWSVRVLLDCVHGGLIFDLPGKAP